MKTRSLVSVVRSLSPVTLVALVVTVAIILLAIAAPLVAPFDPVVLDAAGRFAPVGDPNHLLGADQYGRDTLSRLLYGARVELLTAASASVLSMAVGTVIGLVAGYYQRFVGAVLMRFIDVVLALPALILALFAVTLYGPGEATLIIVMGLVFTPAFARIAYGQTLTVAQAEYVESARLFGASDLAILFREILPNILAPLVVQFTLTVASAILLESGLSYLGLGIVPPAPSWGAMVADGQRYMATEPQLLLLPALAVVISILAVALLADGLRTALNPRSHRRSA